MPRTRKRPSISGPISLKWQLHLALCLIGLFLAAPSLSQGNEWVKKSKLSDMEIWIHSSDSSYRGAYRERPKTREELKKGALLSEATKDERLRAIMSLYSSFSQKDIRIAKSRFYQKSAEREILARGRYENWRGNQVLFLLKLTESKNKFQEVLVSREFERRPSKKDTRNSFKEFRKLLKRW